MGGECPSALWLNTSHAARLATLRDARDRSRQQTDSTRRTLESTHRTMEQAYTLLAESHLRLGDRGSQRDGRVQARRPRAPAQVTQPAASWPIDGAASQRFLASDAGPSSQPLTIVLVAADPGRLQTALAALQRSAVPNRLYVFPNTDEAGLFLLGDGADQAVPDADLTSLGRAGPVEDGREPRARALRILDRHAAPLVLVPPDRLVPPVPDREATLPRLPQPLTPRELEVLGLLARRFGNRKIAAALCISWQTVAKHTSNLYQKLRVTSRYHAVERAASLGLLPAAVEEMMYPELDPQQPLLLRRPPQNV